MTPILPSVPFNLHGTPSTVDETLCRYYAFRVILQSLLRFTKSTDDLSTVHLSASRVVVRSTTSSTV